MKQLREATSMRIEEENKNEKESEIHGVQGGKCMCYKTQEKVNVCSLKISLQNDTVREQRRETLEEDKENPFL